MSVTPKEKVKRARHLAQIACSRRSIRVRIVTVDGARV